MKVEALNSDAIKQQKCLAFVQEDDLYLLVEYKTIVLGGVCQLDEGLDNNQVSERVH